MRLRQRFLGRLLLTILLVLAPLTSVSAADDPCPEPNDNIGSACPIRPGEPVSGTIDQPSDRDVYMFDVPPDGVRIHATLSDLSNNYDLHLFAPDGETVLARSTNPGTADEQISAQLGPGRYYLLIDSGFEASSPTESYKLTLVLETPPPPATPTPPPPPPQGQVNITMPADGASVPGFTNVYVTVSGGIPAGQALILVIEDPTGGRWAWLNPRNDPPRSDTWVFEDTQIGLDQDCGRPFKLTAVVTSSPPARQGRVSGPVPSGPSHSIGVIRGC